MYARLNPQRGWRWVGVDMVSRPLILTDVTRRQGMISGRTPDGFLATRPAIEFDLISEDGESWRPLGELLAKIPKESYAVHEETVPVQIKSGLDEEPIL